MKQNVAVIPTIIGIAIIEKTQAVNPVPYIQSNCIQLPVSE